MKKATNWAIGGVLFTSVFGTLLHFAFEWSGNNQVVGLFSAVNESIWEHMKLIFFPMVVFALLQNWLANSDWEGYWCQKLKSILVALILIPIIYYTYTGILGESADWFNIMIFFISAATAYRAEAVSFQKGLKCSLSESVSVCILVMLALIFIVFTIAPPEIPLFADPRTGGYGI